MGQDSEARDQAFRCPNGDLEIKHSIIDLY